MGHQCENILAISDVKAVGTLNFFFLPEHHQISHNKSKPHSKPFQFESSFHSLCAEIHIVNYRNTHEKERYARLSAQPNDTYTKARIKSHHVKEIHSQWNRTMPNSYISITYVVKRSSVHAGSGTANNSNSNNKNHTDIGRNVSLIPYQFCVHAYTLCIQMCYNFVFIF